MVAIFQFAAVRPEYRSAQCIAAVPYDVVTADEAGETIRRYPQSFLRVSRSDAELPELPPDDARVYERAKENFLSMMATGLLIRDPSPAMYIYRVRQNDEIFVGLACCLDVQDYEDGRICRHEATRYDKEADRTRHIDLVNAHTGPVVLLYRDPGAIFSSIESLIRGRPDTLTSPSPGVCHEIYVIRDRDAIERLEGLFLSVPRVYIADGHHRAKSAANVARTRVVRGIATPESGHFMGVLFSSRRVKIHGYSRLLADLGGYSGTGFLKKLGEVFSISPYGEVDSSAYHIPPKTGSGGHVVHMYLGGTWYECSRPATADPDLIRTLDVTVLQDTVLEGILGITDPRGDARVQYLGGARPLGDLENLVDGGKYALAFSMQPVDVETVLAIADEGKVMPPKSTWFEPKLQSGLLVHMLD
jgi:uncharacterized protein (DUF1015 family)